MTRAKMKVGSRVRIATNASQHQGRTGIIMEQRAAQGDKDEKRWLVRFDWPLGGLASHAGIEEEFLEVRRDLPPITMPEP